MAAAGMPLVENFPPPPPPAELVRQIALGANNLPIGAGAGPGAGNKRRRRNTRSRKNYRRKSRRLITRKRH